MSGRVTEELIIEAEKPGGELRHHLPLRRGADGLAESRGLLLARGESAWEKLCAEGWSLRAVELSRCGEMAGRWPDFAGARLALLEGDA